jgi:hypothetical protein
MDLLSLRSKKIIIYNYQTLNHVIKKNHIIRKNKKVGDDADNNNMSLIDDTIYFKILSF